MKLGNKILLVSLKSIFFLPSLGMILVLIDRLKFYCPCCNPRPSKYILCVCVSFCLANSILPAPSLAFLVLFQVFYKGVYLA